MATATATALDALGIVKIVVDWTAAPDQLTDPINVYRITPDGTETLVIGSPVHLSGGYAVLYDTSPPLDTSLTYRVDLATANRAYDRFQRNVSNGWGTADRGGPYTVVGTASDYSTTGSRGMQVLPGSSLTRYATLAETYTDMRVEATASFGQLPASSSATINVALRYSSTTSHYRVGVQILPSGAMNAIIGRHTGSFTNLAVVSIPDVFTASADIRIEGEAVGSEVRVRAWIGDNRPAGWSARVVDSTHTSGRAGFISTTGSSAGPMNAFFDNAEVSSLVSLSITSNAVTLDAAPDGWIRDPYTPATSVRLDNCDTHTFSCLNAERFVFFQGFEEEQYDSATGVFGVLDAERPITVAQTRKDLTTTMRVVSTTLADIPALRALFRPGRDLVISVPTEYGWGIETYGTDWATIGTATASRLNRQDMRKPQRLWSLPLAVTDPERTLSAYGSGHTATNDIPVPGATYADMQATGLTYAQLQAGTPLNSNPYFESTATPWTALGGAVTRSTAQAHQGSASLLLTPDGVSALSQARSENVPVTAGRRVVGTSWQRSTVTKSVAIQILWRDSGGVLVGSVSPVSRTLTAGEWVFYAIDGEVPAGATQAMLVTASIGGTPASSDTVYTDEGIIGYSTTYLDWSQGTFT